MASDFESNLANPNILPTTRLDHYDWNPEPEPEALFCPILSVDDHVLEPPTIFEGRVPAKYADRVPHVVYDDGGIPAWVIDGKPIQINMMNGTIGHPMSQWRMSPMKFDEFRAGVTDARKRLADLDLSGIYGTLCFSSMVWGFAGSRFAKMQDPEVGLAAVRAYNDWMLEEWCATAPERFISCQLPWLGDPKVAAEEIRKNAARGFRSVSFPENPEPSGFGEIYGDYWEPFYQACAETGTVINLHVGSSGLVQMPSTSTPSDAGVALFPVNSIIAAVEWVYSRCAVRHPDIKIVMSEGGASWVPMILERLGRATRQIDVARIWKHEDPTPVEVFKRNFYFASIEDPSFFKGDYGDLFDHVMVEIDYPHSDSTWPNAQAMIRRELEHLDPDTVMDICFRNAANLYRHPLPPDELVERSEVGRRANLVTSKG